MIIPVGPRTVIASIDNTGNNPTNWTAVFDPAVMAIRWNVYEVYKIIVDIPDNVGFTHWVIYIGPYRYEGAAAAKILTWSDFQPMRVDSGESVYFYFDTSNGSPPTCTMWCQVNDEYARPA